MTRLTAILLTGLMALTFLYLYGVIGGRVTQPFEPIEAARITGRTLPARTVVILGTSLTARGSWVADLQAELSTCAPDLTIEPLASPGASSRWGRGALIQLLRSRTPDLLIVEFSGNDASVKNGFPLSLSSHYHRQIIRRAQERGMTVILATMSPAWGQKAWARPGQGRYHALYRDLAKELGTGLIDTIPQWQTLPDADRKAWVPDDLHPTEEAMRAITLPIFAAALTPYVCQG